MATFTFKTTEDDRPGGGFYKLPGEGPTWTIRQSDYPGVNLSGLTEKNFFLATSCNASPLAAIYTSEYQNVGWSFTGGNSGKVAYTYSGGVGNVSIVGASNRKAYISKYLGDTGSSTKEGTFSYTLFMSRSQIV